MSNNNLDTFLGVLTWYDLLPVLARAGIEPVDAADVVAEKFSDITDVELTAELLSGEHVNQVAKMLSVFRLFEICTEKFTVIVFDCAHYFPCIKFYQTAPPGAAVTDVYLIRDYWELVRLAEWLDELCSTVDVLCESPPDVVDEVF